MKNYTDRNGMYHDKPCSDGEPSSNNAFIYTALARAIGAPYDKDKTLKVFTDCCKITAFEFEVTRLPGKEEPPISRDEILGMASLGLLPSSTLCYFNWQFYKPQLHVIYQTPLLEQLMAVYSLRGKHRNYAWKEKIIASYPIVFKLFWHDRYYVKKHCRELPTVFEWFMFNMYVLSTILQKDTSAKNILWLQLHDLKSFFWIRFINRHVNFMNYFGEEHVFNA